MSTAFVSCHVIRARCNDIWAGGLFAFMALMGVALCNAALGYTTIAAALAALAGCCAGISVGASMIERNLLP